MGVSLSAKDVVTVVQKDGSFFENTMGANDKIIFDGDYMKVVYSDNQEKFYAIAEIERVLFIPYSTGVDDAIANRNVVYPNPTSDVAYVAGADGGEKVEIFGIDGSKMSEQEYSPVKGISMGTLPAGMYIVRMNGRTFKICKK